MKNNISLTVRIPQSLNNKLKQQSSTLGFTKTGMIKLSIHQFLKENPHDISKVDIESYQDKPFRLVLNINDFMNSILLDTAKTYNISVNNVVIRVCILASQYYEELLLKLGFED